MITAAGKRLYGTLLGSGLVFVLSAVTPAQAAEDSDSCAAGLSQPGESVAGLGAQFEILSWNMKKAERNQWSADLAAFAAESDLVFLQEASLQAGIPNILDDVQEAFAPGYRTATLDTGVMTLSAASPSLHCRFSATEPWLRTPKATSVTEHPLDGQDERLLAINLHAVNFAFGLQDFAGQFDAIGVVLKEHTGPVVVAGDLNTWSESRQALVDAFMAEHGLVPIAFEPDLRSTAFGRALDHIYVRGLAAESATVIPVDSSDHNPLRVRLRLDS